MCKEVVRCGWVTNDPVYIRYHDEEWGIPLRDSRKLFEMLCLEGAQAGLSWITILKKRENYRAAFDGFDPYRMAQYSPEKIEQLMQNPGIVRNHRKIEAFIENAKAYCRMEEQGENFSEYIWNFVDGKAIENHWKSYKDIPAYTKQAEEMSKSLKQKGFKFVGNTICYSFMQACGLVNDHEESCFKRNQSGVV